MELMSEQLGSQSTVPEMGVDLYGPESYNYPQSLMALER
jgi:hypothetical protein